MAYEVGVPWKWPSTAKVTAQSLGKAVTVLNICTLYQGLLAANTEGLSSTHSWIPEVGYRYNLSVVQGESEGWDFERKRSQTPYIFWIILDKCNKNGTVEKSDSFLAFNTSLQIFSRERMSSIRVWHLDQWQQHKLHALVTSASMEPQFKLWHVLDFTGPRFKPSY